MSRRAKIFFIKSALLVSVPLVIWGYASGPIPYVTGDPKDGGQTCSQSGCHIGTAVNGGAGSVKITTLSATYTPGRAQTVSVTISDPVQRAWGFELTARLLSDNTQAGNLTTSDSSTFVQCADGAVKSNTGKCTFNTQFIQHTSPKSGSGSGTFTFTWTPPPTSAGTIVLYAAGNAANGDGSERGDHIYTTSVQLTPAVSASAPVIGAVVNAASNLKTMLAANTHVTIYGANLSTVAAPGQGWSGPDFTQNANGTLNMPTSLAGTSVTFNGVPAYVDYVSAGQINVITPGITATGDGIPVVVSVNSVASASFAVTFNTLAPAFFAWSPQGAKYLVAQHGVPADGNVDIGPPGLFATAPANFTTPAAPGEVIVMYGTGFGPTSPAIAPGIETDTVYQLSPTPTATFGGVNAFVNFAGLVPPYSQLFQINLTVPSGLASGDYPVIVQVSGVGSYSGFITVAAP